MFAPMSRYTLTLNPGRLCLLILSTIIALTPCMAEIQERVELPEFEKKTLLNGMQFLFLEGTGGKVLFLLMIKNGAAFDPADRWGVTQLMADMMIENLNDEQTRRELEDAQVEFKVEVDWDAVYFHGTAPPEELEYALSVLSDIVVRPNFDEEIFDRALTKLLQEGEESSSRTETRTQELFRSRVLSGSPYSHPIKGSPETLSKVHLRDIKIQFRRLFMPNQAVLALYYSGDREDLFRRLSRRWGSWVRGEAAPFTFRQAKVPEQPVIVLLDLPEEENGMVRWGYLSVKKASRNYHVMRVLEQYLTLAMPDWAEEISSRSEIRGSARLVAKRMPGYLQVSLKSPEGEVAAYCNKLEETLDLLRAGEISLERFEEAKSLVMREFQDSFQMPLGRLYRLLETDLCELGLNYIPTFSLRLKRVTPTLLQDVARTHFPKGGSVVVVAGSAGRLEPSLREIAAVEVLQ